MKKVFVSLMVCLLCLPLFPVYGAEESSAGSYYDEGITTLSTSSLPSKPSNTIGVGVDLSKWNGTINFAKLSKVVDFVIIRCGYGQDLTSQDDPMFKTYVKGCRDYNIPYGIYLFSYAKTTTAAKGEATHTLRLLNSLSALNTEPSLPVFYDIETDTQYDLSKTTLTSIAKTYCDVIEKAGYTTGIYSYANFWEKKLTNSYFDSTVRWVAQFASKCSISDYDIWQCSENATVSGISEDTDYNYMVNDIYDLALKDVIYPLDGNEHTIVPLKSGFTYEYLVDDEWSTTPPTISETGTLEITYRALDRSGNEHYTGKVNVTIDPTYYDLSLGSMTLSKTSYTYSGKANKPTVTVKNVEGVTISSSNYTVTYKNNTSTGIASVTVTGKGDYSNSISASFTIKPKQAKITSVKKGSKKKSAVIKWSKVTGASGYQIAYRKKTSGSSWSYTTVTGTSKTFTGLKSKKYYVKVRAYKSADSKKIYGSYSSTKTMTAK